MHNNPTPDDVIRRIEPLLERYLSVPKNLLGLYVRIRYPLTHDSQGCQLWVLVDQLTADGLSGTVVRSPIPGAHVPASDVGYQFGDRVDFTVAQIEAAGTPLLR